MTCARASASGTGYVLAVRSNYSVTLPSGRRVTVKTAAGLAKPAMWQRMRTGSATKGAKDYYWAMIEVTPDDTPQGHDDGHAFLLLRKHRYTGTVSYFLCWSPGPVPLAKLISIAVTRWRIEEDHQLTKQVSGLDSGQVTTWTSWHRWTAISLLAYAFPAVAAACQRALDDAVGTLTELIPVTVPELLRQLRSTVIPDPRRDRAPPRRLVPMAPPPPVPRPTSTPALARLRRRGAPITNYSCRISTKYTFMFTRCAHVTLGGQWVWAGIGRRPPSLPSTYRGSDAGRRGAGRAPLAASSGPRRACEWSAGLGRRSVR